MSRSFRRRSEPTLPLINIVFLMLVFFLAAAQLARPLERDLNLVETDDPKITPPADALVLHADGRLSFRGQPSETAAAYAQLQAEGLAEPARILPDRDAPAQGLLKLAQELRGLGAERIVILTKQALS